MNYESPILRILCIYLTYTQHISYIYPTYSLHISCIYPAYTLALFCIYQKTKYSTFSTIMNPHRLNWRDNVDFVEPSPLLSPCYPLTTLLLSTYFIPLIQLYPYIFHLPSYDVRTISGEIVHYNLLVVRYFFIKPQYALYL